MTVKNISALKEEFMRSHFDRMHEIDRKAIQSTSKLAQTNAELIFINGLAGLRKEKLDQILQDNKEQVETIKDLANTEVPDVQEETG